jgi:hypothetical protein
VIRIGFSGTACNSGPGPLVSHSRSVSVFALWAPCLKPDLLSLYKGTDSGRQNLTFRSSFPVFSVGRAMRPDQNKILDLIYYYYISEISLSGRVF